MSLNTNELPKIFLVFASEPSFAPKKSILTEFRNQSVRICHFDIFGLGIFPFVGFISFLLYEGRYNDVYFNYIRG